MQIILYLLCFESPQGVQESPINLVDGDGTSDSEAVNNESSSKNFKLPANLPPPRMLQGNDDDIIDLRELIGLFCENVDF